MINFKKCIIEMIHNAIEISINEQVVCRPPREDMGDFTVPCFNIPIAGLKNPSEKGLYIKNKLEIDTNIFQNINVVGPYLNFTINKDLLANEVINNIENEGESYGSSKIGYNKDLLIEHTSINPNASPHIGRSRNSIIGDFLVNLYKFEGFNVETNYFINDIGKQISMLLVGTEKFSNIDNIDFNGMLKIYIKINELSKTDKKVEDKVFSYLKELENGNELVKEKFKKITDICIKGQQNIFNKMNIKWDRYTYESEFVFDKKTDEIISQLNKAKRLKEDENGRLYVDLSSYNIPTKSPVLVLTREDKTSLYPLRDIAYTIEKINRNNKYNFIVLGEDQEVYMKQISAVLDILGYKSPSLISYSFVLLNGDKMATREGKVVLLEEFIEKAREKLILSFKEKGIKVEDKVISDLAASCIKYNMLNVNRKKTVNFDLESATNFQGNSAMYLLYNYVRINSILDKIKYDKDNFHELYKLQEKLEYSLLNSLYDFPEVIDRTYKSSESVLLTNYLYSVSQIFAKYYENISILSEKDDVLRESRLALLNATRIVLSNGMKLLGINPIQKL